MYSWALLVAQVGLSALVDMFGFLLVSCASNPLDKW